MAISWYGTWYGMNGVVWQLLWYGMNGMAWWYEWYGRMVWYGNGSMNGMVW